MVATLALLFLTLGDASQTPARGVLVAGVVQDQTGAVLPAARAVLSSDGSTTDARETIADPFGAFRFDNVGEGTYSLRVEFAGFRPNISRVRVGRRAPSRLTIVMQLERVTQELSVTTGEVTAASARNLNAIIVDREAIDNLPILDQNIVGAISRFLDASAIGTGGVTLLVDGIEVSALRVPSSAIQQIRINQDPYAAEFMRPGRGRIEIVTKPGGRDFAGSANLRFRDSDLNARNAFATEKPEEQRRTIEGTFGGPVPRTRRTNFVLSGSYFAEDTQAILFAQTPAGSVRGNVATPSREKVVSLAWNHMEGEKHVQSVRASYVTEHARNGGVGGTSLPESASNSDVREVETSFSQQTVFSSRLVNEFRLLVGDERDARSSVRPERRIVVQDAFSGGGAQADTLRTEQHFTATEALTWSTGRHTVKAGINVPDWSWRGYDDRSNTAGSFFFSSLEDYAAGRPYSFTQQAGDGHVTFLEKVVAGFIQDEIRLKPDLSIAVGLRYDWQRFFGDRNNFAPRFSFAFAPGEARRTLVRGGAGIFYDRTGEGPIRDVIRYDGRHLLRYVIVDPRYPDPLPPGQALSAVPSSIVRLADAVAIPHTLQYSVGIERQLRPKTTFATSFVGSRGFRMFRSRDTNAPPPPLFAGRPDSSRGVVRQIESAGRMQTASVQLTVRGQMTRFFNGSIEYGFGRVYNDTSGINWMPPNTYDLSLEWARADFNQRHRMEMFGSLTPGKKINVGVSASVTSGRPYSLTTGLDTFNTGLGNARPAATPRNSLTGPSFATVDVRWSREFESGTRKRSLTPAFDAFNVLNRVNYGMYVGNLSSPFFGRSISAGPPRRIQVSLRVRY